MNWGSDPVRTRQAFQQLWVQEVAARDYDWLIKSKCDVYLYLINRLAHNLRSHRKSRKGLGQAGWALKDYPVNRLCCGCVFGLGGKEQEVALQPGEDGIWWPVVFAVGPRCTKGNKFPCICQASPHLNHETSRGTGGARTGLQLHFSAPGGPPVACSRPGTTLPLLKF